MTATDATGTVLVISSKADWKLARALAKFWGDGSTQREVIEPQEWLQRIRADTSAPLPEPGLVAWRLDNMASLSTALVTVRARARVLSPLCCFGISPPPMLPLFGNDVAVRRPSSYWWLDLARPELLEDGEIATRLRQSLPSDWSRWTIPERNLEEAVRRIQTVCDIKVLAAWLFHGFNPKSISAADIVRHMEALSLLRPFVELHQSKALVDDCDKILNQTTPPSADAVIELVQRVVSFASKDDDD